MDQIRQEFLQYVSGANELADWLEEIRLTHVVGRRSGKTYAQQKYNKIFDLEKKYRERSIELLALINKTNPIKYCIPASFTPIDHRNRRRR